MRRGPYWEKRQGSVRGKQTVDGDGTHLVDIRLRARGTRDDLLDELGDLGHDVDPVESLAERALQPSLGRAFGVRPGEVDRAGFRPVVVRVALDLRVGGAVGGAGADDLAVCRDAADVHHGRAVGGRGGVFHHEGRVGRRLEVDKVPFGGCFSSVF